MDSIFKRNQPVGHTSRDGHDVSQMTKFTSSVGQLLPVYYDFLYPKDEIEISFEMLTRLKELQTDAMVGLTEHIDLFFVPAVQILSYFEDWVTNVNDLNSSILWNELSIVDKNSLRLPLVKDLDLYNGIKYLVGHGMSWDSDGIDYRAIPYNTTNLLKDEFGVPYYTNLYRLCDLLGQGSSIRNREINPSYSWNVSSYSSNIYLMFFGVYQKIFFDYYSLEDRTKRNVGAFNYDDIFLNLNSVSDVQRFAGMTKLRYRPWKTDFFTSIHNSPLYSGSYDPNSFGRDINFVNNWLANGSATNVSLNYPSFPGSNFGTDVLGLINLNGGGNSAQLNTSELRSLFAQEKLLETMRRSRKTWDYQTLAMFGIKPDLGVNGRVLYLGSHSQVMQIGEVVSTSSVPGSGGSVLGQIGGKGASYDSSKKIKFTAPCRGYLMAIYSAVPDADYDNLGLDRLVTYSRPEDFFLPAYDKLGEQPLFQYQVNNTVAPNQLSYVRGWQPRYMESKAKYDRVCGDFLFSLNFWTPSRPPLALGPNATGSNLIPAEANFYIDPCYLDKIMATSFQFADADYINTNYGFVRDPLMHQLQVHSFKKSEMSSYGVHRL